MSMFKNYNQDQFERLFKTDNEHQYDVQRVHEKLSIHSLKSTLSALSIDQMTDFLEYQIQDNHYVCLFYESFFDGTIKYIDSEKLQSIILWISDQKKISPIYLAQFQEYFSLDYKDPRNWKERFEEFIEVLLSEDKHQILNYGREYISQSLKLHEVKCQNIACDYQINASTRLNKIRNELNKINPQEELNLKKIQWKGKQKELAELFKELKEQGWIEDVNYDTIKACFTNSHTIQQVLKPTTNTKTGINEYEGIYKDNYLPKFYGIKENPKPN